MTACLECGAEFERQPRGRPRKFCVDCAPPGDIATSAWLWRKHHPEQVQAYYERRRSEYVSVLRERKLNRYR